MTTPVQIGSLISGAYGDGSGLPNQSHLIFAASAGVWWYFTLSSTADVSGVPGTHTVTAYVSSGPDLTTATWTLVSSSPNLDVPVNSNNANQGLSLFHNGRSMATKYWNNIGGTNLDIVHIAAALYPTATDTSNGVIGNIRAILTATTITWGSWGLWYPSSYTYTDTGLLGGIAVQRASDGRMHLAGGILSDQLDFAAVASNDVDTADNWTPGGGGTASAVLSQAILTSMSTQVGLAVGYGITVAKTPSNGPRVTPSVSTIDSGTQVTTNASGWSGTVGGQAAGWTNFSAKTRNNLIADSSTTNECGSTAIAPLASGNMLGVYDNGAGTPPALTNLSFLKASATASAGIWPNNGVPDGSVFSGAVTIDSQDWCLVPISTSVIYVARRGSTTQINVNVYSTGGNSFSAVTNQPPATVGTIKAGGGVVGVTDGTDFWIFVIDGTNNNILYCKFTVATGTWGVWTILCAVDSTANRLSCFPSTGGPSQAGLVYNVTNGASFDTFVTGFTTNVVANPTHHIRPFPFKPGSPPSRNPPYR